jgi:hypothetical protein
MISFYFQNFVIAPPVSLADQSGNAANTLNTGTGMGDCLIDTFVVSGSGGSSPVICGTNSGQHSKTQFLCYRLLPDFKICIPISLSDFYLLAL